LFLVIFDDTLRNLTLANYKSNSALIEEIYQDFKKIIEKIYSGEDPNLPAKFASYVFLGEDFWDFSLETRVVPALFQIMVDELDLPLWVSWYDLEIEEELVRLTVFFAEANKIEGVPGRVLVAQISDDDRELTMKLNDEELTITTLKGGISLLLTIKENILGKSPNIEHLRRKFLKRTESILKKIISEEETENFRKLDLIDLKEMLEHTEGI